MRRGALPSAAGLHALAGAGTSDSLPVVLEFTGDASPLVRDEALAAAGALLDPSAPDGRAVEPLTAALRDTRLGAEERATIARLLGETGAPRAAPVLAGLARAKGPIVRLAAIDAFGTLGPAAAGQAETLEPLIDALGDPDPSVRLHAAVALADAGDAHARDVILAKLDATEVDRGAVLAALGGILARSASEAALTRLARELVLAAGPERDAIACALGRARAPAASDALDALSAKPGSRRRRCAPPRPSSPRTLTTHRAVLRTLRCFAHRDASVRAQAAWAMGTVPARPADLLIRSPPPAWRRGRSDRRCQGRSKVESRPAPKPRRPLPLCATRSADPRAHVRAAALCRASPPRARGAQSRKGRTPPAGRGPERRGPGRPPRSPWGSAPARGTTTSTRSIAARCPEDLLRQRRGTVPSTCRHPPHARTPRSVYVVPDLATAPQAGETYVLQLADGTLHAGTADRRGAIFDPVAPEGDLRLLRTNDATAR